jgi:esterase
MSRRGWHHAQVPARLYQERVGTGEHVMLLTHGIYGSGANWRGIARKLTDRRPEWSVVLLDLRQHGRSEPGEPPHTLAACAADVIAAIAEQHARVIAGHSFGGKVMLAARALAPRDLAQTWILDSSPAAHPGALADPENTVSQVLELMEQLPHTWQRREDFVAAVVAAGKAAPLASWLAMNLVPDGGALRLRLDLAAIREMLADYHARDLWPSVRDATLPGDVEVVIADGSTTFSAEERAALASLPAHVHVHHVAAGHWLHIDAPGDVVELFARELPAF